MWCSVSRGAAQDARTIANAAIKLCRVKMSILPTVKSEEFFRSCGGCASDFFQRNSASPGDFFRDQTRVSRFTTFSAIGNGCEVRAIRLDHETIHRYFGRDFTHLFTVFERDDSGERNEVAQIENFVGLFQCAAETMKHAADLTAVIAQNLERVVPSVALMNHHVQSQFNGEIEKLLE